MSRAWLVNDHIGQYIAFGRTRNDVLCSMEDIVCCPGYPDPEIKRKKEYDIYADKGFVPVDALIRDGWEVRCSKCGEPVGKYELEYGAQIINEGKEIICECCCE